jgi:hypothetical protein
MCVCLHVGVGAVAGVLLVLAAAGAVVRVLVEKFTKNNTIGYLMSRTGGSYRYGMRPRGSGKIEPMMAYHCPLKKRDILQKGPS